MTRSPPPSRDIARLIEIMAALRTPVTGCPWDLEQTFASIAPYTIEEAYEVADAIERKDTADLKDELGDLLLQVVYHARMAEEQGSFAFGDVVHAVTEKMIRRHPHVFGDDAARSAGAAKDFWETIKAEEKARKAAERARLGIQTEQRASKTLADVPSALPALTRAVKLQDKAARVGFDWPSLALVFDKMREELAELEAVVTTRLLAPSGLPAPEPGSPAGEASGDPGLTKTAAPGPAPSGRLPAGESEGAPGVTKTAAPGPAPSGRLPAGESEGALKEEFGDLLFVMANVARHLGIDPEAALRGANQKFVRRFAYIERRLDEQGRTPLQSSLAEMDALWDEAKAEEKTRG